MCAGHKGRDALNWSQRLAAVIGAGRGIHYLHTGVSPPIFYNNLKITNILLDSNMVAQVSDFGLPVRRVSFSMDVSNRSLSLRNILNHIRGLLDMKCSTKFKSSRLHIFFGVVQVVAAESKSGSGKFGAARLVHDASLRR